MFRRFYHRLDRKSVLKLVSVASFVFVLYRYKPEADGDADGDAGTTTETVFMNSFMPADEAFKGFNDIETSTEESERTTRGITGMTSTTQKTTGKDTVRR